MLFAIRHTITVQKFVCEELARHGTNAVRRATTTLKAPQHHLAVPPILIPEHLVVRSFYCPASTERDLQVLGD